MTPPRKPHPWPARTVKLGDLAETVYDAEPDDRGGVAHAAWTHAKDSIVALVVRRCGLDPKEAALFEAACMGQSPDGN